MTTRSGTRFNRASFEDADDIGVAPNAAQTERDDVSEPPVDDGETDNDPPTPRADAELTPTRLLKEMIDATSRRSETVKPRDPDTFDGSDPRKLKSFLVQCQLNFRDRPRAFNSDTRKVNYVLSYLRGSALEWFEPLILDGDDHPVLSNYKQFSSQLLENFGPYDAVREAEFELERLRMREDHKLTKYTISFNRWAAIVNWDEYALQRQFYKGLASRIKDEIARIERADTLRGLREQAHAIDSRYWARQLEISRDSVKAYTPNESNKKGQKDNSRSSNPSDAKNSDSKSEKRQTNTNSSSGNSGSKPTGNSGNSGNAGGAKKPNLEGKLGQDGKLTPEERQRRFDNNLCLFCGIGGHKANECRKRTSRPKGNAARVAPDGDDSATKND